ncbi:MAG: T9SS type A sorting domain-containing protein [Chitinophagaceae bacterium]
MKKKLSGLLATVCCSRQLCLLLFVSVISSGILQAQGYVRASRKFILTGSETMREMVADNSNNTYVLYSVTANTFPVTILPAPTVTGTKAILIKFDPDGNVLWSRYLPTGSAGNSDYIRMVLDNGTLYLLGNATVTDVPVTNGSTAGGGGSDILYARVDASTGTVISNSYLGGNGAENSGLELLVENGAVYITYTTTSSNIPVTTGSAFTTGYDHVVHKMDVSGNIIYSRYTGSTNTTATNTNFASLVVENGLAYLGIVVSSTNNFITTDGTAVQGNYDFGVLKLDASGNTVFSTVLGGSGDETQPMLAVKSGEVYVTGISTSNNYPSTDGSSFGSNGANHVVTKFNGAGNRQFSSYQAGISAGSDVPRIQWSNGALYLAGSISAGQPGITTTDVSSGSTYLVKLNPTTGQKLFATTFGGSAFALFRPGTDFLVKDNRIVVATPQLNRTGTATDGSSKAGHGGVHLAVFDLNGKLLYATMRLTGAFPAGGATLSKLMINGNNIFYASVLQQPNNYPVTTTGADPSLAGTDLVWSALTLCPPMPTDNTISPLSQTICTGGFTQSLTGNKVAFASSNMPLLYRSVNSEQQTEIQARYQWQTASDPAGPWTNIAGAGTQKDYSPPSTTISRYYRRIVLPPAGCGDDPVSTSPVAAVLIGSDVAPTVTAGIFNTCVGTPVNISATVNGGTAPYAYTWDNGIGSTATADATVTPTGNSVYTLTVTDNNGCQQAGQVIVNAYKADAGPATASSCAGSPVRIGTAPPAGLAGVTYSWSPVDGLDNPNIAQPLASPLSNTTYTLTMTVPVSGGGTCSTTDDVTVNVVAAPTTANFAGDDKAVCLGGSLTLGLPAEPGFTYTWSPSNYLDVTNSSTATFNAGSEQPRPNTFTYTLTAAQNGCSFTDAVNVSVLEVDAGDNLCGPRTVGVGDLMPNVSGKTYLWEKISGPGTITGSTNTPTTTVSASVGGNTIYRLTVSLLGVSCSDEVVVGECATDPGCPILNIDVVSDHGCPSTAFGAVKLVARPANLSATKWTYVWSSSPAGGISATTGTSITLTDNVERDITLTVTSIDNPAVSCTKTIHVNAPSWALPSFTAQDPTICPGNSAQIGAAPVAGYTYLWSGVPVGQENLSDPAVAPGKTTAYIAKVKDDVSGCYIKDTATVTVKELVNAPGADWTVCSNAVLQLGSPALPGYTYSWVPAVAAYQGGTSASSAEPKVLIATSQDFTLTVTDAVTGCSKDSTVHITVDNSLDLPTMNNATICKGESVTIGNPGINGVTYSWSPATGLSSTTVAQPVANPLATQTYTLTVTYYDAFGSPLCTKTGDVTVTVNAPTITMSDETICPSDALYNLSTGVTVNNAVSYAWQPAVLVTTPTALSTTVKANPNKPTIFTLTATDANGCRTSASKTVSPVNGSPIAGSNSMLCVGNSITLGDPSNTGTLTWTVAPAIAGTLSSNSSPSPVFTPAAADGGKTFVFTLSQDIGGCVTTATVSVIVKILTIPAMAPQTVCSNASTIIGTTAQPNVSYFWTPETGLADPHAATTTASNITSTTAYTLTAIDINGCSAESQAVIGVNPTSAPDITIPDVTVGVGNTATPFNPQITPASPTYTYSWTPANRVDNPYIANATGVAGGVGTTTYTLAVTDDNGCTSTAQAKMNVVQLITLPITLSQFRATNRDCGVYLNWKVETADMFSHFIVERGTDGVSFSSLASISYEAYRQSYYYEDVNPGNGKWYYRLKLVDLDGTAKYSSVVEGRVDCQLNNKLIVYPNPIGSAVNVSSSKAVKKLVVVALTGVVVTQQEYNQSQPGLLQLQTSKLMAAGTYVLQVWNQDGTVQYVKLLKQQ